jgi:hypothetical protein
MASSVVKLNWKQLLSSISEYQKTNIDQWDKTQSAQRTVYSNQIPVAIEKVSQERRHSIRSSVSSDKEISNKRSLNTRLSTPTGKVVKCSASRDEEFYGSKYIEEWEREFTEENGEITFNSIYESLVMGLRHEGEIDPKDAKNMAEVMDILNRVKMKTVGKRSKQKMKALQECCVIIYKMDAYVYRVANKALRDADWNKLYTIGPYCYLLFNYISRHHNDYSSIKRLFTGALRSTTNKLITVYRGDTISNELIDDYQQAIKDDSISFKWQSFVSTSLDERVAKKFGQNVLYIIELDHHSAKDQCVDLTDIGDFEEEREVLLRPGVRFKVTKMEFDAVSERLMIYIKILQSYISLLLS